MNILILLRHSGSCESDVRYEGYKIDVMLVGENTLFVNLISAIAAELGINELKKNILRSDTLLKVISLHCVFRMIWGWNCT